jgi:plasmid segregation protein ParM
MQVGVDAANCEVKICSREGVFKFPSDIGEYRERNLVQEHGNYDLVWEYDKRRGFAGTLAQAESELGGSRKGGTKAHFDAKLRALLGLYLLDDDVFDIVIGQPIGQHNPVEKQKIKEMLKGWHIITVNGKRKRIFIRNIEVASEGASSIMGDPKQGLIRLIDIGSGTINFATLKDMRYIDKDSFTEPFGMETLKTKDLSSISRAIVNRALNKWSATDKVYLVGGGAEPLLPFLKEDFSNCELLQPKIKTKTGMQIVRTVYANAVGFYKIAVSIYE